MPLHCSTFTARPYRGEASRERAGALRLRQRPVFGEKNRVMLAGLEAGYTPVIVQVIGFSGANADKPAGCRSK